MPWYGGKTLSEAIDELIIPKRFSYKPLRIAIFKVKKIKGNTAILAGIVISGKVKNGMHLVASPGSIEFKVRSIEICYEKVDYAFSGDCIGL